MNIDNFRMLLTHPRWLELKEKVLEKDGHCCTNCKSPFSLDVYHKDIQPGRKPWEYKIKSLITLCNVCAKNKPAAIIKRMANYQKFVLTKN